MLNDIKHSLKSSNALTRLIIVNVIIFVTVHLTQVFLTLFNSRFNLANWFNEEMAMYSDWDAMLTHPWGILTYQFVHQNLLHILFNMLWLFWMGRIFVDLLGYRKLLSVYLLGGVAGAFIFAIAYHLFPLFTDISQYARVIGASASVLAITIATATLVPDYSISLLFFGQVRLKYLALAAVLLDLLSISGSNAGGHIAHLGGALFGFIYIRQLKQGNNLGRFLDQLTAWIEMIFKPNKKMKVVYSKKKTTTPDQQIIDRILDKISKSGYESLSAAEKEILFKASKN
ncbi:MAG: rhomboid family intramembrane serine protease [Bacteroidia bacterium]|nr:rhomboid family intramembrane serine protease [Bacteroidia bacterium]MCZ2277389.1 rhomboid family intramembrane serine protease [Bacteroidia bacterium]